MNFRYSKRVLALGAAGLLAAAAIGTSVSSAQEPSDGEQRAEDSSRPHGPHFGLLGLRAIVGASGLEFETFRAGFAEGQTINEILAANGIDSEDVKATVLANLETKLDELVANGRITQERADEFLANAPAKLDRLMNADPPEPGDRPIRRLILGTLSSVAESIGIEVQELGEALRGGETPADIAEANGVDPQQVIDNIVADVDARLDEKVAEGEVTPDEAAEILEMAAERAEQFVNEGPPPFGEGRGPGRGPFGGEPEVEPDVD